MSFSQDDWVSLLPSAEFAYNNSKHSATKQSPFFSNYGFHPAFLPNLVPESSIPALQNTFEFLQQNNKVLQEIITKAQLDNKKCFDMKRKGDLVLEPGKEVWLSTANLRLTCPSKKLGPKFVGPFPVQRRINDVAYELTLPESLRIHPILHVSLLKTSVSNPFAGWELGPPEPVINSKEEYEVETIIDFRKRRNQLQYLIKWKGYGPEEKSWEPESNIHAKDLILAFRRRHPEEMAQLGIRRLPLDRGHCQGLLPCRHVSMRRILTRLV